MILLVLLLHVVIAEQANNDGKFTRFDANMDNYVDAVLKNAREEIKRNNLEPLRLPELVESFRKKVLFVWVHGEAKLYDGYMHGLSTVQRAGPTAMISQGDDVFINANIMLSNIVVQYKGHAKFMNIGPSITAHVTVDAAQAKFRLKGNLLEGFIIEYLTVTYINGVDVNVYGLGPLNWMLSQLSTLIVKNMKYQIASEIEGDVRQAIQNELSKLKP